MATPSVTNDFVALTTIESNDVDRNFADIVSFLSTQVVQADGSVTMTGRLTLSATPTSDLHAATKSYVDTAALTKAHWISDYSATAVTATGIGTTLTDLNVSKSFTAVLGHYYAAVVGLVIAGSAFEQFAVSMCDAFDNRYQVLQDCLIAPSGSYSMTAVSKAIGGISGAQTFKLRGQGIGSSGLFACAPNATSPAYIQIVDLGTA